MAEKSTKTRNKRTGRRPKFEYKEIRKFESFEAFEGWWKAEGSEGLERDHSYRNSEGEEVEYFRCSSRGCGFRAKVVYSAYEPTVSYHTIDIPHNPEAHVATAKLTNALKRRVKELFDEEFQPKKIRETLLEETEDPSKVPSINQIHMICKRLKTEAAKPTLITLEDLEIINHIAENSKEPADENAVFVVGSTPYKRHGDFCIVWSTKSLITIQSESEFLAINGVPHLTWQSHVMLFAGTYVGNVFRPVYLALVSRIHKNPISELFKIFAAKQRSPLKFVQSDISSAITECCQEVFPEARRLHDVREVSKDMEAKVNKSAESVEHIEAIRRDIATLGFALTDEQFSNVSTKAVERWRELGVAEPVLDHFTTSWLSSPNCYWYQGASPFPVTCEALESEFHAIKRVHSLREKMKFEFFNKWLHKTIQVDWIEEKDAISTEIPQPLYSEAYSLSLYGRSITGIEGTDEYLMPSESAGKIKIEERLIDSLYSSTYKTFEDFVKTRFQVYHLRKTGPKTFSCTCKFGSMKKPCKHAVYLACSLQLDSYPEVDAAPGRGVEVIRVEPR